MDADFTEAWKSYLKLCRLSASDFYTNMIKKSDWTVLLSPDV